MAVTDVLTSRAALRNELRKELLERFEANYRPVETLVEGGPGRADALPVGLRVLTRGDVGQIVEGLFTEPLPAPSDKHAEVTTPATVTVSAVCPECGLPNLVVVNLTAELLVDDDGKELRVKAKTKGRVHVCGQLELPGEHTNGQMRLDEAPGTAAKFSYEIVEGADVPPLAGAGDDICEAAVETPDGALACYRVQGHPDDLHWNDGLPGTGWRLRLAIEGATVGHIQAVLALVGSELKWTPSDAAIEGWSQAARDEVAAWATAVHLAASDHDDIVVPPVPAVLVIEAGEAIAETLPDVEEVLGGELVGEDSELLPGGPAVDEPTPMRCVGNNHIPGCQHMGGAIPPKRAGK